MPLASCVNDSVNESVVLNVIPVITGAKGPVFSGVGGGVGADKVVTVKVLDSLLFPILLTDFNLIL